MGIHGNGLTHEMWMPENSTLIEVSFASLKNKVKIADDRCSLQTRS
jgi:hypothetical protein